MKSVPISFSPGPKDWESLLERYIDECKPDPIVLKQMQTWSFAWISTEEEQSSEVEGDGHTGESEKEDESTSNIVSGRLEWTGEHMQVTLQTTCRWTASSLEYTCHA